MADKNLRKTIGSRAKARRIELGLTQDYIAEQMDVNKSTIQRYESGLIDNTKKLIVEGLAKALHVSAEWLRGETDEYESDVSDEKMIRIKDSMQEILDSFPLKMGKEETLFSQNILLALLREYLDFNRSFEFALDNFSEGNDELARLMTYESGDEYKNAMFLREITHTINTLNQISDALRIYSKNPEKARMYVSRQLDLIP